MGIFVPSKKNLHRNPEPEFRTFTGFTLYVDVAMAGGDDGLIRWRGQDLFPYNKHPQAQQLRRNFAVLLRLMVCDSAQRWAIISCGGWRAAHGILPSDGLNRCHGRR